MAVSTLPIPGITPVTGSASVAGGLPTNFVVAFVGSAPSGPAWPLNPLGLGSPSAAPSPGFSQYLSSSKVQAQGVWGNDAVFNDIAGYTVPGALRIFYENLVPGGFVPLSMVVRTNTTQADIALPNTVGSPGGAATWHATARLPLGGSMGNGVTVQLTSATQITITPTTALTKSPFYYVAEVFTIPSGATWATIANIVNPQSKLIWLSFSGTDSGAIADVTLATLTAGTDGANPGPTQMNAALDQLAAVQYADQMINLVVPLYADSASGGVIKHALTNAIAALANGQRFQVLGSVARSAGGSGNTATIVTMATDLIPTESSGDSGRASLFANNQPQRVDPQLNAVRLYPEWAGSAGVAAMIGSVGRSQPIGRLVISGFDRFAENYSPTDRQTLHNNGVMVCRSNGRLVNQATTANITSYRREQSVQRAEDFFVADLANFLDTVVIEQVFGQGAGQQIQAVVDFKMRDYVNNNLIASYTFTVHQSTVDARIWEVDILYVPNLPVTNINPLNVQLSVPVGTSATAVVTL